MEAHAHQPEKLEVKAVRSIWSMLWVRLCIVFLLGCLAGFVIFTSFSGRKDDAKAPIPEKQAALAGLQPADSLLATDALHYDSPLTKASCKVRYSTKIVEIRVELSSLYPVKSLVEFDVNNLVILNVQDISVNDQSTSIIAANSVQFNSVGDNKYVIILSNKNALPHRIDFKLTQNELPVYQNSVEINKE